MATQVHSALNIPGRRDPRHNDERLRVSANLESVRGHRLIRTGRFILASKRLAHDGKIVLAFENQYSSSDDSWSMVGRNGVIRIPEEITRAKSFSEGCMYSLYLWKW